MLVLLFQSVVTDQLDRTRGWTGKEGKKSPKWEEFNELCCTLYNVLRKHSDLFINLISIMVRCCLNSCVALRAYNASAGWLCFPAMWLYFTHGCTALLDCMDE